MKCFAKFFLLVLVCWVLIRTVRHPLWRAAPPTPPRALGDNKLQWHMEKFGREMQGLGSKIASKVHAQTAEPATEVSAPAKPEPKERDLRWLVTGDPELSIADGIDSAFEQAQRQIGDYLSEHNLVAGWKPPIDFIRNRLLRDLPLDSFKESHPDEGGNVIKVEVDAQGGRYPEIAEVQSVDNKTMYRVRLFLVARPDAMKEMLRMAHHKRMSERLLPVARGLGCLVALFAAVGLYIRFDELSKGYYRNVLRLMATGFVALTWLALAWPVIHTLLAG